MVRSRAHHRGRGMTAEVSLLNTSPAAIEQADPAALAEFVTSALQESKAWLAVAMERTDPTPIAEFKAWAATVEEATRQKKLGREIELDAAEMVRRAERGIGVAIRKGQEAGEIRAKGQRPPRSQPYDRVRNGQQEHVQAEDVDNAKCLPSPTDFASKDELASNGTGIYSLTDDISDEQFDAAIDEAKAEGNLSRANLVRKVKGEPAPKPADRPEHLRRMRRHDSNRIVEQTVIGLEGYVLALDLIDFDALDPARLSAWSSSLATSLQSLNRLSRRLKELDQA